MVFMRIPLIVRIAASNVGNIANQEDDAGFYSIAGGDTTNNLFDASGFMAAVLSNGDSVVPRHVFDDHYMHPLTELEIKDTSLAGILQKPGSKVKIPAGDYKLARGSHAAFVPSANGVEYPGPWFGVKITDEWWLPDTNNAAWEPVFLLWCQTTERTGPPSWWADMAAYDSTATNLYLGVAADWDVKSEIKTSRNFAPETPSPGTGMVWQAGCDTTVMFASDSALTMSGRFAFIAYLDSLPDVDPYSANVATNPLTVYNVSGYVDEQLYLIATTPGTNPVWHDSTDDGEDDDDTLPTDLNMIVTGRVWTPPYTSTNTCYLLGIWHPEYAGVDVYASCSSFAATYNQSRSALGIGTINKLDSLLECSYYGDLWIICGDANLSNTITLADVVSIINYVFNKPGWPDCWADNSLCWLSGYVQTGDVNWSGTVTIGDAIQLINYIFNKPCHPNPPGCWEPGFCFIPI
jgi:hypothetical protein